MQDFVSDAGMVSEENLATLRRYVVCYNPSEAERQMKHREQVLKELKEELRVSQTAISEREKRNGLWVIHTNDEELSAEDLALAYKQLVRVARY